MRNETWRASERAEGAGGRPRRGGSGARPVFQTVKTHTLTPFPPPPPPPSPPLSRSNDKRATIKADHPTWGIGEIGKELGALWKKTADADKVKYTKMAEKDKERYAKALEAYKGSA